MNKCFFIGRTTADIELRYAQGSDLAVGTFSLAVDEGYGEKKHTSFLSMTCFGKSAESLQKYVAKGGKIAVECRARQDTWKDNNGNNRSRIGFVVDQWEFAESKNGERPEQKQPKPGSDDFMSIPDGIEEELPFN